MKERPPSIKWLVPPRFSDDGVQISSGIAVDGREYPDPVPMAPPVGYSPPTALEDLITQIVRRHDLAKAAAAAGVETFEEADDFEVDEDYDPRFEETIYEAYFEAKAKRAAENAAALAEVRKKASADLDAAPLKARMVETPKSVSGEGMHSSVDSPSKSVGPVSSPSQSSHNEGK